MDVLNFGVDEILQVGTQNKQVGYISDTTDYTYVNAAFDHVGVTYFNGTFTGSFIGTDSTSSFAVVNGVGILTASYFSGSNLGGTINGVVSSSFEIDNFTGSIASGSLICLYGTASGVDARQERSRQYMTQSYADHALIKFDITAISKSIASGDIVNPSFYLKVKICNEFELPEEYAVYVAPISESWVGGIGYMSDGGSDQGASWVYRDFNGGTPWAALGGTWMPTYCTQSFKYKSADIDMDVTPIVNQWLAGLPNNGFIILSSDEFRPTGSGFLLKYFSNETNTIYSPVLDVGWNDSQFVTGSFDTASVQISKASGSTTTVQNGSTLMGAGGVHGNFTAFTYLTTQVHYVTASNVSFTGSFIQQFTGSFSGSFYGIGNGQGFYTGSGGFSASFTGSIDGIGSIELTSSAVIGTNVQGYIVGDVSMPDYLGTFSGSLTSSAFAARGYASGIWLDELFDYFLAFVSGSGFTGNIANVPIIGQSEGLISTDFFTVTLPNEMHYLTATSPMEAPYGTPGLLALFPPTNNPYKYLNLDYVWGGDEVGWKTYIPVPPNATVSCSCGVSHSVQMMTGSFTSGPFAGDSFTAYYENYKILFASLSGSWNSASLIGSSVLIPLPQASYPYVTAYVSGIYVNGTALGLYTIYTFVSASVTQSSATSASFVGQFINGPLVGGTVDFQLSGSASTSSYAYTSSVNFTSSLLYPLDVERQFSINLTNLQSEYKAGDIIKLNVFGRKKYPQKFFDLTNQQSQYLVPEFLPSTSYYALKDNQTDEIVVDFDSYTHISCAYPEGNYFLVDTTGLAQERYYRVLIRVTDGQISDTIDTGKIFKITR